jgi:hypothetical protein
MAVLATVAGPGSAADAGAGDVRSAKAQVQAMQAKVDAVARRLSAGSRAYEAGERHLAQVQRKERATRRQAQELSTASVAEQRRLDEIASSAYRHPLPGMVALAMSSSGSAFTSGLVAKADLEHVSGSQQDVLREVVAAHVRAENLTRTAEQLSADARATERRLARQLADLRATAAKANAELQNAAAELARAQAAERARLAREAAARRASRLRALSVSGPMCVGESTSGYANGFIPDSALCPLVGAPGHKLRADAAAAFNKMTQYHAATAGGYLCVTDSYRSYAEQVSVYYRKPGLAATPGTSEHGWGKAVDFCGGVQQYGSDAFRWMKANAGRFGFFHPGWAEPGGSKPEAWHWEFSG